MSGSTGAAATRVARAMQSDSARIWDLAFAEPVRAIAVSENEALDRIWMRARGDLVTATQGQGQPLGRGIRRSCRCPWAVGASQSAARG